MRASAVWCAVRRCATKASRSTRRLAVEVADVRRAVDGHGARDEVMMAPAEVVQALLLRWRNRDDRLDGRASRRSSAAARSAAPTTSIAAARRAYCDAKCRRASDKLAVDAPGSVE